MQSRPFELAAFLRALYLIFSAGALTAFLVLPAFAACLLDRSRRWPSFFQRLWSQWLLAANGVRLRVTGLESIRKERSYILICNHASILDIPAILSVFPFAVRFMAKKSLAWFPVFGWFLYFSGHILMDRESPQSALKALKGAMLLLRKGMSVIVFPEGTRTPDGKVKEFKRGAFLLAIQARAPILPLAIFGTYGMLPRTGWCFRPGTLELRFGEPVATEGAFPRDSRALMVRVRQEIVGHLASPQARPRGAGRI